MSFNVLMKMASSATTMSSLDNCPWHETAYHRYGPIMAANKYVTDTESCLDIAAMQAIIMDLNNDLRIDRCEFSLMCVGTDGLGGQWDGVNEKYASKEEYYHALGEWCVEHSRSYTW